MEFNFECAELLGCHDGVAIIDGSNPPKFIRPGGGFGTNAHRSSSNFMGGNNTVNKNSGP